MVRIAIVIPYASMANLAWDVFQEHTEQMRLQALDATEYSLDILVASTTQELLPQWPDCDAMIARGATYLDLCRRSLSIPVIELIINGTDIVNTLLQLRQKYGPVPAAILGTQNMILGVEKLARQLGVDVTPYCFQENSLLEIRRCVEQAARDGKRVIIGGGTGCRLAEEIGLTSMLITSGREAFWNAISEAKQQAKISQVEREKALSFQTMLDNAVLFSGEQPAGDPPLCGAGSQRREAGHHRRRHRLPPGGGDRTDLHAHYLRPGGILERHLGGQAAGQDQSGGTGEGPELPNHAGQRL